MHRVAWFLVVLSLVGCAVAAFVERPWALVAGGGAVVLLVAGLTVAWRNGRGLQRRWLAHGVHGVIVLDEVRAEFTDDGSTRCAVVGTVQVAGRPAGVRTYQTFVPNRDLALVVAGARLPATVLDEDPGAVRVRPDPARPAWIQLRER